MPFTSITPAKPATNAERVLMDLNVAYERRADGVLEVPGSLNLSYKGLTELPDLSSVVVRGSFFCEHNQLTTLRGAPKEVGGSFFCYVNRLTTLEGAPRAVGGDFECTNNNLFLLEHAPERFKKLKSDFGDFDNWNKVPERLRLSPQSKARLEEKKRLLELQQQEAKEAAIRGATVLDKPLQIRKPFSFKK
jgi:hypothetical protein